MAGAEDYGKAVADFWTMGSRSLLAAQEGVMRAVREGASGLVAQAPGTPPAPGADAVKAVEAMTELWSSALGMCATLAGSLPAGGADGEGTAAATLRRMMDPRGWLSAGDGVDEALQRLAEGPRLADAGDMERRFAKVSRAWLALRQRSMEHQGVVLEGWMRAGRDFAARVAELGKDASDEGGEAGASSRRMLDLWVETANTSLLETQRSEAFLRGQAALLKASTDLRFAQRDIAEHYAESFGLPTRRELDDVHRSVTEMRRELRALQRRARAAGDSEARAEEKPAEPPARPGTPRAAKRPVAAAEVSPPATEVADLPRPPKANKAAGTTEAAEVPPPATRVAKPSRLSRASKVAEPAKAAEAPSPTAKVAKASRPPRASKVAGTAEAVSGAGRRRGKKGS